MQSARSTLARERGEVQALAETRRSRRKLVSMAAALISLMACQAESDMDLPWSSESAEIVLVSAAEFASGTSVLAQDNDRLYAVVTGADLVPALARFHLVKD